MQSGRRHKISLWAALLPIVALLGCLVTIIAVDGPDAIAGYSPYALLGAATLAVIVAASAGTLSLRGIKLGLARQTDPSGSPDAFLYRRSSHNLDGFGSCAYAYMLRTCMA